MLRSELHRCTLSTEYVKLCVKVKVELEVPVHAVKASGRSGDMAPFSLSLDDRWR
jgi:hypothetical protein